MRCGFRWAGLVVLVLFAVPATRADDVKQDKKPADAKKKSDKKADDKKSAGRGKFDFKDRVVVLRMLDGRLGKVDDFQKLGLYLAYIKDNKVEYLDKEADLPRAEDVVVRYNYPPPFDDKGRPKNY